MDTKRFATWPLAELTEHIVGNCHQPAKREISIIYDIAHVVAYKHSDRYPQLRKLIETLFLSFDHLLRHLRMEESTFFPLIGQAAGKAKYPGPMVTPMPEYIYEMAETLPKDHKAIANDLEVFRELTRSYTIPDDGCFLSQYLLGKMKRFDREMSFYMHLENTILLPKAIALARQLNRQPRPTGDREGLFLSIPAN